MNTKINEINFNDFYKSEDPTKSKEEYGTKWVRKVERLESEINALTSEVNELSKKQDFSSLDRLGDEQLRKITKLLKKSEKILKEPANAVLRQLVKSKFAEIESAFTQHSLTPQDKNLINSFVQRFPKFDKKEATPLNFSQLDPSIVKSEEVIKDLRQIQVLNQMEDKTGSGFENCGLHALKNACVAIACCGSENATEVQKLFASDDFFLKFYHTFCKPALGELTKGKADVSLPTLREVMKSINRTEVSDPDLKLVQDLFIKNQSHISFLSIVNEGDLPTSPPLLSFFDKDHARGIAEIVSQFKSEKPFTHLLLVGNQEFGHWYTFVLHQDEEKKHHYYACDSFNNHHSDIRGASELAQMTHLFETAFTHPDQLLERSLLDDTNQLEKIANWIGFDGQIQDHENGEKAKALLDDTPNPYLSEEGVHNGSNLGQNVALLLHIYQVFKKADLLTSPKLQHRLQIAQLKKTMTFLIQKMGDDDPSKKSLAAVLKKIENVQLKSNDYILPIFTEAFTDLENHKAQLTSHQFNNAEWTLKNIKTLYEEIPSIVQEQDETKRINLINSKLGTGSAEAGFTTGNIPEQITEALMGKVHLLLLTYQNAKDKKDINNFFKCFAKGDNCLNNRIENLIKYSAQLSGIGDIDSMVDWDKVYDLPAAAIAKLIENKLDDEASGITEENYLTLTPNIFDDQKIFDELIIEMKRYQSTPNAISFINFLISEGIYQEGEEKNWEEIMQKVIKHPRFTAIFNKAIRMIV